MLQTHPYCALSVRYHPGVHITHLAPTGAPCATKRHYLSVMHCTQLTQQTNTENGRMLLEQKKVKRNITIFIYVGTYPRRPCYTGATHQCAECHLCY